MDPMNIFRLLVTLLRILVWKFFPELHRRKRLITLAKNSHETIYTDVNVETAVDLAASCNNTFLRIHTDTDDESFIPANLCAGVSHSISSRPSLPLAQVSESKRTRAFHSFRNMVPKLTKKDVANFGVAVEAFFPHVTMEEIITVKDTKIPSSSPNSFVEQLVATNCSPFQESSTVNCALSSTTGHSYIEDSYDLHTGANFITAIEDSDDERFMKFAERELAYDRLVISESMQEEANERIMLIKASQEAKLAGCTPSKVGEVDTIVGFSISGEHAECDIRFNGSPLSHSSPKCENSAQRNEAPNSYWKIAWVSSGSSGLDISDQNKKESFRLASLSSNSSSVSEASDSNDDQEAGNHHGDAEQLDDTDVNMNLLSILGIATSYFNESRPHFTDSL